jgi:hypothetical protein
MREENIYCINITIVTILAVQLHEKHYLDGNACEKNIILKKYIYFLS